MGRFEKNNELVLELNVSPEIALMTQKVLYVKITESVMSFVSAATPFELQALSQDLSKIKE